MIAQHSQLSSPPTKFNNKWYERCGKEIFTELIGPFLINPQTNNNSYSSDLSSLLLSCKFIYGIFSHCDEFWIKLIEREYKHQLLTTSSIIDQCSIQSLLSKEEDLGRGKLLKIYFQIKYYEKHIKLIPTKYLMEGYQQDREQYFPQLVSASNLGFIYAEGFSTQLCAGYFIEGYDPAIPDIYKCQLDDGRCLSIFGVTISETIKALVELYLKTTSAMIFTLAVLRSGKEFKTIVEESFGEFEEMYKMGKEKNLFQNYVISFGIHYGGKDQTYSEQYKQDIERQFRQYLSKFGFQDSVIMECNLYNREQVKQLAQKTLNALKPLNLKVILPILLQGNQNSLLLTTKKKCCIM